MSEPVCIEPKIVLSFPCTFAEVTDKLWSEMRPCFGKQILCHYSQGTGQPLTVYQKICKQCPNRQIPDDLPAQEQVYQKLQLYNLTGFNVLSACIFQGIVSNKGQEVYTANAVSILKDIQDYYPDWRLQIFYYPEPANLEVIEHYKSDFTDLIDITTVVKDVSGYKEQAKCWRFLPLFYENHSNVILLDLDKPIQRGLEVLANPDFPINRMVRFGVGKSPAKVPFSSGCTGFSKGYVGKADFKLFYDTIVSDTDYPSAVNEELLWLWFWRGYNKTVCVTDKESTQPHYEGGASCAYHCDTAEISPVKRKHFAFCWDTGANYAADYLKLRIAMDSLRERCKDAFITLFVNEFANVPNSKEVALPIDRIVRVPVGIVPDDDVHYYKMLVPLYIKEPVVIADSNVFFLRDVSMLFDLWLMGTLIAMADDLLEYEPVHSQYHRGLRDLKKERNWFRYCNTGVMFAGQFAASRMAAALRAAFDKSNPAAYERTFEQNYINDAFNGKIMYLPHQGFNCNTMDEKASILHFYGDYKQDWDGYIDTVYKLNGMRQIVGLPKTIAAVRDFFDTGFKPLHSIPAESIPNPCIPDVVRQAVGR